MNGWTADSEKEKRIRELKLKAVALRKRVVTLAHDAGSAHIGGALSCTDMITALFYEIMNVSPETVDDPDRDIFIMSKGHTHEPYLCALSDRGFITEETLRSFRTFRSDLLGHPNCRVAGVEINSGALGHGLSVGVGAAIAKKRDGMGSRVYVLMGDGELAEGSVWEAAMSAGNYKLNNLVAIIDRNRLQLSGATEEIMKLEPLEQKWASFGFETVQVDGNDMESILGGYRRIDWESDRPKLIISNTTKGKGVSFMENTVAWHAGAPDDEQYELAMEELEAERRRIIDNG